MTASAPLAAVAVHRPRRADRPEALLDAFTDAFPWATCGHLTTCERALVEGEATHAAGAGVAMRSDMPPSPSGPKERKGSAPAGPDARRVRVRRLSLGTA